jgi:hypothetical protein
MNITDFLAQAGGLRSLARELGVSDSQAASGAEALIPAILGGFKKQAQAQPQGIEGLGGLLNQLGGGVLLDNVLSPEPTDVSLGNQVLGEIFGSKDVSRSVAQNAAVRTGLDPELLKKMLPMLAMLVAGFMSRRGGASPSQGAQGGLGGMLEGMLGSGSAAASGQRRGGGLADMLDMNGDGNPLDDILRLAGKVLR